MLGEIARKIDQSDLDWQQKLDAYARLKRNADADDAESREVSGARAEADADYIREHLKTTLSREESDFLEEQAQRAEAREERRRQQEYAREMENRREAVAWQMELLRMEHEQQDKAEAAQQRILDQQMEIDKLKLMLNHYERVAGLQAQTDQTDRVAADRRAAADQRYELDRLKLTLDHDEAMGRQSVDTVDILAGAQTVRAQVEKEYAERFARRDQEAEEKRRAEKAQREDQYADRAEALLRQMWDIQKSIRGLELENDREFIRGRAQVDAAQANRRDSDLEQLIQDVQKLAGKVEKVRTRQKEQDRQNEQNEQARQLAEDELLKSLLGKYTVKEPAKVKYTVDPTIPVEPTPSFTAGGSTLKCPHCGHPVYRQTVTCPYCNKPVQG